MNTTLNHMTVEHKEVYSSKSGSKQTSMVYKKSRKGVVFTSCLSYCLWTDFFFVIVSINKLELSIQCLARCFSRDQHVAIPGNKKKSC